MSRARPRLLIEASKLDDAGMDGIKRYVVELLQALRAASVEDRWQVDLLIRDRRVPLSALAAETRPARAGEAGGGAPGLRHRILSGIGALVPPILLPPIRALIPAWASRRLLGKEKAELSVAGAHGSRWLQLLPPAAVGALRACLPQRLLLRLWDRGLLLPFRRAADPDDYDLVHLTLPNNRHYLGATRTPMLVTVHDLCHLACPEHQTRSNNLTLRLGLDRAVADGASFLAVSEATRQQLLCHHALEPSRAATVPSGCRAALFEPVSDPARLARVRERYRLPDSRFLLTLSTLEPRKNLVGAVRAFEILTGEMGVSGVALVIAGPRGWKSGALLRAVARNRERIVLPGFVDDEDLAALYSAATAFVYPSHYEGFGLPLLEAMRCGVPVVYGDNSAMPELVGDAGLPVDSRDPRDIARQLRRLLEEDGLARHLGGRAFERAQEWTWQRTASETAALYAKLLRGEGPVS